MTLDIFAREVSVDVEERYALRKMCGNLCDIKLVVSSFATIFSKVLEKLTYLILIDNC